MNRILPVIVLLCPLAIWSQDIKPLDAKPGLWETTSTMEMSGMPAAAKPAISQEQLDKMPPEARAKIEAMLQQAGGSPRTTTTKSCMTRESLSKGMINNTDKSCTTKLVSSSSSSQVIHTECRNGNTSTSGDMKLDRIDSEHVKGSMLMKTLGDSSTAGRTMDIKMTFSTKWLGSDCGDVKPYEAK